MSIRWLWGLLLIAATVPMPTAQSGDEPTTALYRNRQWFALRAALPATAPAIVRAVVSANFNDRAAAEPQLRQVIADAPASPAANDAHNVLTQIYLRSGQYDLMAKEIDAWSRVFPASAEFLEAKKDALLFRGLPDQRHGPIRRAVLRHDADAFSLPVSFDGHELECLFDTGAWMSVISVSAAARFGLTIREGGELSDGIKTGQVRMAVAPTLVVGGTRFEDVSFAVVDAPGDLGIVGIPILLALGRVDWSKSARVEIGGAGQSRVRSPNLVFNNNQLLLRLQAFGKEALTLLDTGAQTTDLTRNFAAMFPDAMRGGQAGTRDITGFAGTEHADVMTLPEIIFRIGSRSAALRPAQVLLGNYPALGQDCCVGNAGHDLLNQGSGFVLDLAAMTLTLR